MNKKKISERSLTSKTPIESHFDSQCEGGEQNEVKGQDIVLIKVSNLVWDEVLNPIQKFILSTGGTCDDVKDVLQDTILCLCSPKFRDRLLNNEIGFAYAMTVARNIWLKSLRQRKIEVCAKEYYCKMLLEPDTTEIECLRKKLLLKHILLIGVECRKLILTYFKEKKAIKVAEHLGLKLDTYKKKKGRCFKILLSQIKKDPEYPDTL